MNLVRDRKVELGRVVLGSVVVFPTYGTSYIVHVADQAAIEKFNMGHLEAWQLVRLDGKKPYRQAPFTPQQLVDLITQLKGEVYTPDLWELRLGRKIGL